MFYHIHRNIESLNQNTPSLNLKNVFIKYSLQIKNNCFELTRWYIWKSTQLISIFTSTPPLPRPAPTCSLHSQILEASNFTLKSLKLNHLISLLIILLVEEFWIIENISRKRFWIFHIWKYWFCNETFAPEP